jgi:hypothetical protein
VLSQVPLMLLLLLLLALYLAYCCCRWCVLVVELLPLMIG